MNKKECCINNKTIAVFVLSNIATLNIKYIDYTSDTIYFTFCSGDVSRYHKSKIYYGSRPYIKFNNNRYYIDNFMKVGC